MKAPYSRTTIDQWMNDGQSAGAKCKLMAVPWSSLFLNVANWVRVTRSVEPCLYAVSRQCNISTSYPSWMLLSCGPLESCFVLMQLNFRSLFRMDWNRVHYYLNHYWSIAPAPDDDECGAVGGMIGKGNRSTRRKPAPVQLHPPQMPHGLTRAGARAASVRSRRLTAWPTARPYAIEFNACQRSRKKSAPTALTTATALVHMLTTSSYPFSSHLTSGDCDDFCPTICLLDSSVLVVIVS
jgi:hypothetical protein